VQSQEAREGDVGEDEETARGGISVGVAPANSRPAGDGMDVGEGEDDEARDGDHSPDRTRRPSKGVEEAPPDKQSVFADWKSSEGKAFEEAFDKNRQDLKEKKTEMREQMNIANIKKKEIDVAKERLQRTQAGKQQSAGDDELIDEEEYALIRNVKELKQQYRDSFESHRQLRTEVLQLEHMIRQCKQRLVGGFEDWYEQKYGHQSQASADATRNVEREGERYDPQEQFDLLEADRLEQQHPDALAYHKARKNATRNIRQKAPNARH